MRAAVPADEQGRLQALRDLHILDAPPRPDLEDIARLAAQICGTPTSLVSLIDTDRVCLKAGVGLPLGDGPREHSFCAHAILGHGLLVVPDARTDGRFADNPFVLAEPGVRFYAGAPLITSDGFALGTLCVVDSVPRRLNLGQLRALRALARQVTAQLELSRYAVAAGRDTARRQEIQRLRDELGPLVGAQLREPLAELRRTVELLRDLDYCPPELAQRLGEAAHARAPELLRLLDDLLRLAGPAGGRPPLQRRGVDLSSLVDWAVREVRPIADAKDIVLRLDAGMPAPVLADPHRLAQALSHLLFNAVKFTPCAGRVRVRVSADPSTVELHHTGVRDEPARLFRHVLNGVLRRSAPTTGTDPDAGLAAVKAILDAHHACVALCDGPDDGTALQVVFPPVA